MFPRLEGHQGYTWKQISLIYSTKKIRYFSLDLRTIRGWSTLPHLICFSRILKTKNNKGFKVFNKSVFAYLMSRLSTLLPWSMRKAWSCERYPFSPTWKYWSTPAPVWPLFIFLRLCRSLMMFVIMLWSVSISYLARN